MVYKTIANSEKDIYTVITGEEDVQLPKNLNPVFYVSIYDEKPESIPDQFDIEIMTSNSGDSYTCLIPIETSKEKSQSNDIQNEENLQTITNTEITENHKISMKKEKYFEDKSREELLQELDTIENRNSFLLETIEHQHSNQRNVRRQSNRNLRKSCFEHRNGYWTYEMCLYGNIYQYHGKGRSPLFNLGDYTDNIDVGRYLMEGSTYEWNDWISFYDQSLFTTNDNFLHMLYTDGDGQRSSLVTIVCPSVVNLPMNEKSDGIISFSEPHPHFYHFKLAFSAVCSYSQYLTLQVNAMANGNVNKHSLTVNGENIFHSHAMLHNNQLSVKTQSKIQTSSDDIALLLKPLLLLAKTKQCLILNQGWWSVEFCYGKYIRQVHFEAHQMQGSKKFVVKRAVTQENMLGLWSGAILNESYSIIFDANDNAKTYAKIIYANGDFCEVSKKKRQTEIRFLCGTSSDYSVIVSSREDPSCEYIVQIETPLICGHPSFKIAIAPSLEIVCYPLNANKWQASDMKMIADVQSEYDEILKIVNNAALYNAYEKKDRKLEVNYDASIEMEK